MLVVAGRGTTWHDFTNIFILLSFLLIICFEFTPIPPLFKKKFTCIYFYVRVGMSLICSMF
ncbi:hypothetical protein Hanom_Chr12g01120781 [Helianthus anomalus]